MGVPTATHPLQSHHQFWTIIGDNTGENLEPCVKVDKVLYCLQLYYIMMNRILFLGLFFVAAILSIVNAEDPKMWCEGEDPGLCVWNQFLREHCPEPCGTADAN